MVLCFLSVAVSTPYFAPVHENSVGEESAFLCESHGTCDTLKVLRKAVAARCVEDEFAFFRFHILSVFLDTKVSKKIGISKFISLVKLIKCGVLIVRIEMFCKEIPFNFIFGIAVVPTVFL